MIFRGRYWFLSNFYPVTVQLDGVDFPSVEHGYQAAKTLHPPGREVIRREPTPGGAKRLGRTLRLRPDWERVKLQVMESLLRQKFTYRVLWEKLRVTHGEIVEENPWGDTYWGRCRGVGENHLGRILTRIRDGT